ncbi:hypothetical protein D9M68_856690 [compost metagenome]
MQAQSSVHNSHGVISEGNCAYAFSVGQQVVAGDAIATSTFAFVEEDSRAQVGPIEVSGFVPVDLKGLTLGSRFGQIGRREIRQAFQGHAGLDFQATGTAHHQ